MKKETVIKETRENRKTQRDIVRRANKSLDVLGKAFVNGSSGSFLNTRRPR